MGSCTRNRNALGTLAWIIGFLFCSWLAFVWLLAVVMPSWTVSCVTERVADVAEHMANELARRFIKHFGHYDEYEENNDDDI